MVLTLGAIFSGAVPCVEARVRLGCGVSKCGEDALHSALRIVEVARVLARLLEVACNMFVRVCSH